MGLKQWLFGSKADQNSSKTQFSLQTVEVEGDFDFLAKGTSYRQAAINLLGLGEQQFLLTPERGNTHDELAVMVQGIHNNESVHVGYLPKGSDSQVIVHELGSKMIAKGAILSIKGNVLQGETGLIVQLRMPSQEKLIQLEAEYS